MIMNRVTSLLQRINLRQVLTVFLVGIAFFVGALGHGNGLQAIAGPLTPEAKAYDIGEELSLNEGLDAATQRRTPEAKAYQLARTDLSSTKTSPLRDNGTSSQVADDSNDFIQNSQQQLKDAADNIREKLNLDQPIAPETKEFFRDIQDKSSDTIEGIQRTLQNTGDAITGD